MGPEGRSLVPRYGRAQNAHGKTYRSARQCVLHGPIGREPRDDVAGYNAVDSAIDKGF